MASHGLTKPVWGFVWDRHLTRIGFCEKFEDGTGQITVSRLWVKANEGTDFLDGVVLHEVAHALVGPRRGHDECWHAKCLQLGGFVDAKDFALPSKYFHRCSCGQTYLQNRTPRRGFYRCECNRYFQWSVSKE